jgi:hypothetical protein
MPSLSALFDLDHRGTTVARELRGGLATVLTMASGNDPTRAPGPLEIPSSWKPPVETFTEIRVPHICCTEPPF